VTSYLTTYELQIEGSAKQRRRQPCTVLIRADWAAKYRARFAKRVRAVEIHALFFEVCTNRAVTYSNDLKAREERDLENARVCSSIANS
jgi:hypothetical protein